MHIISFVLIPLLGSGVKLCTGWGMRPHRLRSDVNIGGAFEYFGAAWRVRHLKKLNRKLKILVRYMFIVAFFTADYNR